MTIIEASDFFKELLKETDNKGEVKIYNNFIGILLNLESRDLSGNELLTVQNKIETLDLKSNPENKRKYFSKRLKTFKGFLKDEFSLIPEGYYTAIGMSLGMCFGVAIGTSFGVSGTSIGLSLGMLIGLAIGRTKDLEAEKQNLVLKTKIIPISKRNEP